MLAVCGNRSFLKTLTTRMIILPLLGGDEKTFARVLRGLLLMCHEEQNVFEVVLSEKKIMNYVSE